MFVTFTMFTLELPAARPCALDVPYSMGPDSNLDVAWAHYASWGLAGMLLAS